ncbi:MAG: NAD(P)/FAD-dependent oxidoreductase [Bacteriovoracaceae bacterium]
MAKKIEFTLRFDQDLETYVKQNYSDVLDYHILSQSLDARKASRGRVPTYHYILEVKTKDLDFENRLENFPLLGPMKEKPLIIGAGPAGLFCALRLSEYGIPSIIIERGAPASKRMLEIAKHWRYGVFNEETNVCYGEGGAGLFSDGKLITRIKSPLVQYVMNKFVEYGAPADTAYTSNPHLGSNKIRSIITKITDDLKSKGTEIYYNESVEDFITSNNSVVGVKTRSGKEFHSNHIVLATGHSAKNIYEALRKHQVSYEAKDFAIGVRIEHPRSYIDQIQYGEFSKSGELGAARYRLSYHNEETDKGTYSFCMCPGGYVLSSGTEKEGIVVNGMSNFARNSPWSNSALVVSVKKEEDFKPGQDALGGVHYQTNIEKKAFAISKRLGTGKELPAVTLKEFMEGKLDHRKLPITSSPSGLVKADLGEILPQNVMSHLKKSLLEFDHNLKGYVYEKALLIAPETRTSAPVTILRNKETLLSTSHLGLYPCGEGAGHAGGITSAAVDGIKVAESLVRSEKNYSRV